MTTINTSNALGAKVLRHLPFNGTEGEIVGGAAVTLGAGGSYVDDPTNSWRLVGSGAATAASLASLNIPSKSNITVRFAGMISSTQAEGSLFGMENWDGAGGGILAIYSATKLTLAVSGHGYGLVKEFPIPSRDVRHVFEMQFEIYAGANQQYARLFVDGPEVTASNSTPFATSNASNTGISSKPIYFLGVPGFTAGKGYMEDFTVFDGLTSAERASLASNPDQIFGGTNTVPTVAAPTVVGTPQVGSPVSYTPGAVTGTPTPVVTQQWTIDGANIDNALDTTYTPVAGDVGKLLAVKQIATNSEGNATGTSAGKAVVAASGGGPAAGTFGLTMTGATYGPGMFGQALTGGYGTVNPSPVPTDKTKDFVILFRFKRGPNGPGVKNTIFSQPGVATVWIDQSGDPQFSCAAGTTNAQFYNFHDDQWHFGNLRFIGNVVELYIDGAGVWGYTLNRMTNAAYNPSAGALVIGAEAGGANPFGGAIDDFSVSLGDYPPASIPDGPTNTKQPGLLAAYSFEGNGSDTAGSNGTLPNGDLIISDLQGQKLTLSGTTYNGVTKGTAWIYPNTAVAGNTAENKSVAMVISGTTWTATFETIVPGSYGSKKMSFFNDAGEGVSLTEAGFVIMGISGGGQLEGSSVGAPLTATLLTLSGASSGLVGAPSTITVGTDNPLLGSEVKTVTLSSPNGTFNPPTVTLNSTTGTQTSQYTPSVPGASTLTAAATGLTSGTRPFMASSPVATPAAISLPLTSDGTTPVGYLANLQYAWFDEALPQNFTAPKLKGNNGIIDGGTFGLVLSGSALGAGQTGFLILTNTNGDAAQNPPALVFAGSVKVQ